jgi:Flp pilus assembly protein TadD
MSDRFRIRTALVSLTLVAGAVSLVACRSLMGPPAYPPRIPPSQPGTPQPAPGTPEPQAPAPPTTTPSPPAKEFRLSAASSALVKQARTQSAKGDFAAATATVERALRIEPDNPLLWIELGQVHLAEGNAPQAESMARKAVALATEDPNAQSASWRLVGDALRARGRTLDATEAYQRANAATPR